MTPHLCEAHQREWDETDEGTVQARIRTHTARPAERKASCGTCRATLLYPNFLLCKRHALSDRLCQQCQRSTLTTEEQAEVDVAAEEQEKLDLILDDYTIVIKNYGRRSWVADEFRAKYPDLELASYMPNALDARDSRPIWKEVLGPNIYQKIFCDRCSEEQVTHGFRDAQECDHLAIGRAFKLCHLCAVRSKRCAACGVSPVE